MKKNILVGAVSIGIIVGCYVLSLVADGVPKYIRYYVTHGSDIIISAPTSFYFSLKDSDDRGELYKLSEEYYDPEFPWDGYEYETETYHVFVNPEYLDNDDAYLYVSGLCVNYPFKPTVNVDGRIVSKLTLNNTGHADGIFSKTYISKLYHFYFRGRILEGHTYEMSARCDDIINTVKVMFHADVFVIYE